jgi:hypothetical protein
MERASTWLASGLALAIPLASAVAARRVTGDHSQGELAAAILWWWWARFGLGAALLVTALGLASARVLHALPIALLVGLGVGAPMVFLYTDFDLLPGSIVAAAVLVVLLRSFSGAPAVRALPFAVLGGAVVLYSWAFRFMSTDFADPADLILAVGGLFLGVVTTLAAEGRAGAASLAAVASAMALAWQGPTPWGTPPRASVTLPSGRGLERSSVPEDRPLQDTVTIDASGWHSRWTRGPSMRLEVDVAARFAAVAPVLSDLARVGVAEGRVLLAPPGDPAGPQHVLPIALISNAPNTLRSTDRGWTMPVRGGTGVATLSHLMRELKQSEDKRVVLEVRSLDRWAVVVEGIALAREAGASEVGLSLAGGVP